MRRIVALLLAALVGSATAYAQEVRGGSLTTQDYIDIQQLYAKYNWAIDAGDTDAYVALYTADGSFNNFQGQEGLRKFMSGRAAGNTRHWNTNLLITPTAEGAKGAVYLLLVDVGTTPPAVARAAKYDDVLVKTAQGWRFKKRVTQGEGRPPTPATGGTLSAPTR